MHKSRIIDYSIMAHPVMGWYVMILLAVIMAVPPLYFLVSPLAANLLSLTGTIGTVGGCAAYALVQSWQNRHS